MGCIEEEQGTKEVRGPGEEDGVPCHCRPVVIGRLVFHSTIRHLGGVIGLLVKREGSAAVGRGVPPCTQLGKMVPH